MDELTVVLILLNVVCWIWIAILQTDTKRLKKQREQLEDENETLQTEIDYYESVNKTLSKGLNHFTTQIKNKL